MKNIILILSLSSVYLFSFGQSDCRKGGILFGKADFIPENGVLSQGAFSMDAIFSKKYHKGYTTSWGLEFNGGRKTLESVITDITFEGGYLGYADFAQSRIEFWSKFMVGKRFGNVLEVTVPFKLGYRKLSYFQEFFLNPGQEINPNDVVDNADDANSTVLDKNHSFGLGTGVQLALFPAYGISPFVEVTYNTFGKITNYRVQDASLENGLVVVPNEIIANSNNITIRYGVRFNIGRCPKILNDIYKEDTPKRRKVSINRHTRPVTKTKINQRVNPEQNSTTPQPNKPTTQPSNNQNNKPGVVLKPSAPKPTPKPTPNVVIPN